MPEDLLSAPERAAFSPPSGLWRAKRHYFYHGTHFRPRTGHSYNRTLSLVRVAALSVPFAALTLSGVPTAGASGATGQPAHGEGGTPADLAAGLSLASASRSVDKVTTTSAGAATTTTTTASATADSTAANAALQPSVISEYLHLKVDNMGAPAVSIGTVAAFGNAPDVGPLDAHAHQLVGVALAPGGGYWGVDSQGTVFSYGDVPHLGSAPDRPEYGPAIAIVASPRGTGYWVVTQRGAVFPFGDAKYYGSPSEHLMGSPIVGMAATPTGRGYWLVTQRGRVFCFGDARFFGPNAGHVPGRPIVGIAPAPSGYGYWLANDQGSVFTYGHAQFYGSLQGHHGVVTAIAASAPESGYWLMDKAGKVFSFGHAIDLGSPDVAPRAEASALAATPYGLGYVVASVAAPAPPPVDISVVKRAESTLEAVGAAAEAQTTTTVPPTTTTTAPPTTTTTAPPTTTTTASTTTTRAETYLGEFTVTCYDNYGYTRSGALAGSYSVAVDPRVIPLGTQIYVDGVGSRTADDTGGAIIGNHIDIWEPSYDQCVDWGVQTRGVYRLNN